MTRRLFDHLPLSRSSIAIWLAACKSQPIIRFLASFDPSAVTVGTALATQGVARPTSLLASLRGGVLD
jgi:hypothetical protein